MGADGQMDLHRRFALMIEGLVILYTDRVGEMQGLQFAHGVAAKEGDGTTFLLGGFYHPVEEIGGTGAFDQEFDVAALWSGSGFSRTVRCLGEAKTAMQYIDIFAIEAQFGYE